VKDWGESVGELMIGKNYYNKLNTVLSGLGVFTFSTCCILVCLAYTRIVASFKLPCLQLLFVDRVYCCNCLVCIVLVVLYVFL